MPSHRGRGRCSLRSRRAARTHSSATTRPPNFSATSDRLDGLPARHRRPPGSHRTPRGIHVHRADLLDPLDRREHLGIPVTSPARSLLDLAAVVDAHRTRRAIRRALGTGKVTIRQLGLVLERYPGRRGSATLREPSPGRRPTKSDAESDVLDIVLTAGIERPDVNRAAPRRRSQASSRTSAGRHSGSSSRWTARPGIPTRSRAPTTASARRCSRRTAKRCCACNGSTPSWPRRSWWSSLISEGVPMAKGV